MEEAFYTLARIVQENQEREAQAVKGYTDQLEQIWRCMEISGEENRAALEKLEAETKEKIADELNHQCGLIQS